MKKSILLLITIVLLSGCNNTQPPQIADITVTPPAPQPERSVWSVYDPDSDQLWNRVFRQLYRRTTSDGSEYGFDELDPLLWLDTIHLLDGPSYEQAIQILDEFLSNDGEILIQDPRKRAMFQRDLWAVFDWLTSQSEPYPSQRQALQTRLAQIMKRVALPKEEILSLPDNYALEVEARSFPAEVTPDHPEEVFLPSELFQPDSAWVSMGRKGGPVAMTHTEAFPFLGRSAFLVFVRSPDGRAATLDFIEALNSQPNPVTLTGLEVALVRRMLLIDDQGEIMLSPMVETIQVRHFSPVQSFYEFELDRIRLFNHLGGGLVLNNDLFMLFMGHGDVFESPDIPELRATIPGICKACHFHDPSIPNSADTGSIISYSRQPFALPDNAQPSLFPTTVAEEAQTVIQWKRDHVTWKSLESLWGR